MIEEFAAGGVDAVGAAAEIDLVEVQLENLVLGELALHRHRQDRLANLAARGIAVVEEDRPRQLLRDGGRALKAAVGVAVLPCKVDRAGQPLGIDTKMRAVAAILDGDHRVLHHLRNFAAGQPAPVAGADFLDDCAVHRAHADHLALLDILKIGVTWQFRARDCHHDDKRDQADQPKSNADLRQTHKGAHDGTTSFLR